MDGCVTEIYLSINVSVNVRISVNISTSISTEYANPDPHAGSVTLQQSPEDMGLWVFV